MAAEAAAAADMDLAATGCVGGDGMGRVTDLGEVEEVERDRVVVMGRVAECECDECDGDGDCCGSAIRNDVIDDDTDGS